MSCIRSRTRLALLQTAAVLGVVLLAVAPAAANPGAAVGVATNFPTTTAVGDVFNADISLYNTSDEDVPTLTVIHIHLNASCVENTHPCPGSDAGVFDLSATASGAGACAGTTFAITDDGGGLYSFIPDAEVTLQRIGGGGQACTISFQVSTTGLPATDSNPTVAGLQTGQVAHVVAEGLSDLSGQEVAEAVGTDTVTFDVQQEPNAIPTVSEWGLVLFAGILALVGVLRLART